MSFRAKGLFQQWTRWLCAALVGLAAYVVLSQVLYGSMSWNVVLPENQRIVLPILALFWLFAWETRWDGVERKEKSESGTAKSEDEKTEAVGLVGQPSLSTCDSQPATGQSTPVRLRTKDAVEKRTKCELSVESSVLQVESQKDADPRTGEELYAEARALPHQRIPDFDRDAEYLTLLAGSAAKGHSPALVKLGEYAMLRAAWVEAYYWMKQAQRCDMHGLSPILREIRKNWAAAGFPRQSSNVSEIFTAEAGALGRALLRFDSGHEAAKAKEFLKANHPEFLRTADRGTAPDR